MNVFCVMEGKVVDKSTREGRARGEGESEERGNLIGDYGTRERTVADHNCRFNLSQNSCPNINPVALTGRPMVQSTWVSAGDKRFSVTAYNRLP